SNSDFRAGGQSNSNTLARIYAINEDSNGNLWIGTVDSGVWQYDGNKFTHYTEKDGLSSQAINTIYKDLKGDLWFGTDSDGVFKFNGETFVKFKP
ncbi:MAG: diguanylate cyclase, partial [Flavobacterium sp.]|nr:diguanylate cyclase [Flavobacterium sp.]